MRYKTFLTKFTLMNRLFLFCVNPYVLGQAILPYKTLLTIFTLIWFLFCVNPDVLSQVISPCKTLLTIFTLIWFLFCVNPNVFGQYALKKKPFLTIFTLMAGRRLILSTGAIHLKLFWIHRNRMIVTFMITIIISQITSTFASLQIMPCNM